MPKPFHQTLLSLGCIAGWKNTVLGNAFGSRERAEPEAPASQPLTQLGAADISREGREQELDVRVAHDRRNTIDRGRVRRDTAGLLEPLHRGNNYDDDLHHDHDNDDLENDRIGAQPRRAGIDATQRAVASSTAGVR